MSSQGDSECVDSLISGIARCLQGSPSPLQQASAVRKLARLRDSVLADGQVASPSLVVLACAGLTCGRSDDADLQKTSVLIFVVVLLVYAARGQEARDDPSPEDAYANLDELLRLPGVGSDSEMVAWALGRGTTLLHGGTLAELEDFADTFYRATERLMQLDALRNASGDEEGGEEDSEEGFLSLSLHGLDDCIRNATGEEDPRLLAVVAAADSEAGQVVLRDMYLSFVLPMHMVGVRRGLLLPRETAHLATASHAEATQDAHEVAMAGAMWLFENSKSELRRMVSVLAGLACLLTREGEDPVRKGVAFGGRVALPFLQTRAPTDPAAVRLCLDRWSNRWTLYRLGRARVEVLAVGNGFQGLMAGAVGVLKSL